MTATDYDVILIGGGHNGLTCGSYLAKAGLKVIVFERRHNIGGCVATEEVTLPGFKHNTHSCYHGWIHAGPVYKDLELEKYGSKYVFPEAQYSAVFKDGRSIILYKDLERTCKEIEKFSPKDAQTYREINKEYEGLRDIFMQGFFSQPVPATAFETPFMQTEAGLELIRMMRSSPRAVAEDLFESEEVRTWCMGMATQMGNGQDMFGTGFYFLIMFVVMHIKPWGISIGGSRMLAEAMTKFLEAHGGKVMKNTHVDKILVEGGKAVGVKLADGTKVTGKTVISNTHPPATFLEMVGEEHLTPDLIKKVKRFKPDDTMLFMIHLALNEPAKWKAAEKNPDIMNSFGVFFGFETCDEYQTQFNDIKEGILPRMPGGLVAFPTVHDPTQAPPGKHTGYFNACTTYFIKGGWDEEKNAKFADDYLRVMKEYAPNMDSNNIIGRFLYSPLDQEREIISVYKGGMMLGAVSPDQMFSLRPFPTLRPYRAPGIEGLYMCGGHNHSGGGTIGAPGYNCANAIADDLKLKKWWEKK
jgi:phytoene dehydrogenase-like protein